MFQSQDVNVNLMMMEEPDNLWLVTIVLHIVIITNIQKDVHVIVQKMIMINAFQIKYILRYEIAQMMMDNLYKQTHANVKGLYHH
jgi:hypothetical protein